MAMEVMLVRRGKWLAPAEAISEELVAAMKQDEVVTATIRRPRNPKHHRLFFTLLNAVFENQTRYATLEHLLDAVKLATGHYDTLSLDNGREIVKLRSISFASMDQTSFSQFYDRVLDLILTKILPNTNRADLENRVLELTGEG